jgi:hypothetical protein
MSLSSEVMVLLDEDDPAHAASWGEEMRGCSQRSAIWSLFLLTSGTLRDKKGQSLSGEVWRESLTATGPCCGCCAFHILPSVIYLNYIWMR